MVQLDTYLTVYTLGTGLKKENGIDFVPVHSTQCKTSIIIQTTSKTCCTVLHDAGLYLQLGDRQVPIRTGKNALAKGGGWK